MDSIEIEFFEEYKRLEKLCCDIFSIQRDGVKEYIFQMSNVGLEARKRVDKWENDILYLKRAIRIRNEIAHDTRATDCCVDDIEFVSDFYQRILDRTDPLAVYAAVKKKSEQEARARCAPPARTYEPPKQSPSQQYGNTYYSQNWNVNHQAPYSQERGNNAKKTLKKVAFAIFIIGVIVLAVILIKNKLYK